MTAPKYPGIPVPTTDLQSIVKTLLAVKESIEIGQRLRGNQADSFVRLSDLEALGILRTAGTQIIGETTGDHGALTGLLDDDHPQYLNTARGDTRYLAIGTPMGEANNGANLGTGAGVFADKNGLNLRFKSLKAGSNVTLTPSANEIEIAATGGGGGGGGAHVTGAAFVGNPVALPVNDVHVRVPSAGTITRVSILTAGGTGSCEAAILRDSYANFPPTLADSITGGVNPSITAGDRYENTALTGWTTAVNAGDVLTVRLVSSSTFTYVAVIIEITSAGGGGGTVSTGPDAPPAVPNAADDEFTGTSLDTAGTRRPGAIAWTEQNYNGSGGSSATPTTKLFDAGTYMLAETPAAGSSGPHLFWQPVSGSTWRFRAKLGMDRGDSDLFASFQQCGIFAEVSGTGRRVQFHMLWGSGGPLILELGRWNGGTFANAITNNGYLNAFGAEGMARARLGMYFELELSASALTCRASISGLNSTFRPIFVESIGAGSHINGGTIDRIGLVMHPSQPNVRVIGVFDWFRRLA